MFLHASAIVLYMQVNQSGLDGKWLLVWKLAEICLQGLVKKPGVMMLIKQI